MKILLIEHTCSEFVSSRLALGEFLIEKNNEIYALVPHNGKEKDYRAIINSGLKLIKYPYERNDTKFFSNLNRVLLFRRLLKKHQFDIVHSFKFQPNFYAVLAKIGLKKIKLVLHITGLGVVFSDKKKLKIRLLRFISKCIFTSNFLFSSMQGVVNP